MVGSCDYFEYAISQMSGNSSPALVGQQTKKSLPLKPITLLYFKQGVGLGRLL